MVVLEKYLKSALQWVLQLDQVWYQQAVVAEEGSIRTGVLGPKSFPPCLRIPSIAKSLGSPVG